MIPSKAIKNEKIMETLLVQANSGMYREHEMYFEACKEKLLKQDSRFSSEWESFDMALFPKDQNLGRFRNCFSRTIFNTTGICIRNVDLWFF